MSPQINAPALQRFGLLCGLLIAVLSGTARSDSAPDERYRLETHGWQRGCPGRDELRREIVQGLGRDPFDPSAERKVSVTLDADAGGLGGTVELLGEGGDLLGRRRIASSHRRCADLAQALTLVVILALDEWAHSASASVATSAGGRGASTVVPATKVEATSPLAPSLAGVSASQLGPRWWLAAGMRAGLGNGPGPSGGVLVAVEARWHRWSLGLEVGADDQTGASVVGGSVSGIEVAATLSGCARPRLFGLQALGVCGLLAAGGEHAEGSELVGVHAADGPSLSGGARLVAELFRTDRLLLAIDVDALAPLVRAQFTFGGRTLWQAPLVGAAIGARVAFAP